MDHALAVVGGILGGAAVCWFAWNRHWRMLEHITRHA